MNCPIPPPSSHAPCHSWPVSRSYHVRHVSRACRVAVNSSSGDLSPCPLPSLACCFSSISIEPPLSSARLVSFGSRVALRTSRNCWTPAWPIKRGVPGDAQRRMCSEASRKAAPRRRDADLWQRAGQLAVGLTHAARQRRLAVALLLRGRPPGVVSTAELALSSPPAHLVSCLRDLPASCYRASGSLTMSACLAFSVPLHHFGARCGFLFLALSAFYYQGHAVARAASASRAPSFDGPARRPVWLGGARRPPCGMEKYHPVDVSALRQQSGRRSCPALTTAPDRKISRLTCAVWVLCFGPDRHALLLRSWPGPL